MLLHDMLIRMDLNATFFFSLKRNASRMEFSRTPNPHTETVGTRHCSNILVFVCNTYVSVLPLEILQCFACSEKEELSHIRVLGRYSKNDHLLES